MDALDKAACKVGGMAALASAIGVSQSAPFNWKARGNVPAEHCPAIERATGGEVTCEELRPDVAWDVLRDQAKAPTKVKPGRRPAEEAEEAKAE